MPEAQWVLKGYWWNEETMPKIKEIVLSNPSHLPPIKKKIGAVRVALGMGTRMTTGGPSLIITKAM